MNVHKTIVLAHEEPFRIGEVAVRPATRELQLHGRSTILEPRVMQVLVALWRAGGHVVSKDDLTLLCWDGRIVGDDAINRVISRLRQHAAKDAGGAFRVETITKVGYRLRGDALPADPDHAGWTIGRRELAAGGLAAAVLGLGGWQLMTPSPASARATVLIGEGEKALISCLPDQFAVAIEKLKRATALDPGNSRAWGLLSVAYIDQSQGLPRAESDRSRALSNAAARRALAIDPHNGDAQAALLSALPIYGHWLSLQRAVEQQLAAHPDNAFVNIQAANFSSSVGRTAEALPLVERAAKVYPDSPGPAIVRAFLLDTLGRIAEAQESVDHAYQQWPTHYGLWFTRLYVFAYNGRIAEAMAMIDSPSGWPVGIPPDNQAMTRAQILALADRSQDKVDDAVRQSLAMAEKGAGFAENALMFLAAMGKADQFYRLANRYYFDPTYQPTTRYSQEQRLYLPRRNYSTHFLFRRSAGEMRSDPRFEPLVRRIGLDAYWKASGRQPDYRRT